MNHWRAVVVASVGLLGSFTTRAEGPAPEWVVEGEWLDTCSCAKPCPCWKDELPTLKDCQDLFFYHVEKGNYGDLSLAGANVVEVLLPAAGKKMDQSARDKDYRLVNFYVSRTLPQAEVDALFAIFSKLSFAPPASAQHHALKSVDLDAQITANQVHVTIPKILKLEVHRALKPDGTPKVFPLNTTVLGWAAQADEAEQVRDDFSDDGFSWQLKGRNATLAHFKATWPPPAKPSPGPSSPTPP
jgi:hypothetical protein